MIRAAAVLIHMPFPSGSLGTAETLNLTLGEDGVEVFIASLDGPLVGEEGLDLFDMFRILLVRFGEIQEPIRSAVVWR